MLRLLKSSSNISLPYASLRKKAFCVLTRIRACTSVHAERYAAWERAAGEKPVSMWLGELADACGALRGADPRVLHRWQAKQIVGRLLAELPHPLVPPTTSVS